ncbi:hypothetical protein OAF54_00130 [bacterium]|nr:hypothetical protein [bacterium]
MEIKRNYTEDVILAIPDLHMPYHHQDAFDFLKEVKRMYQPSLVVNLGDALDFHNISFHDSDPDLYNAGDELAIAQEYAAELEKIFPKKYVVGSNHGDLPLRKFVASGMPRDLIKSYNEIYGVGDEWKFVPDLTIKCEGRDIPDLYFAHGIRKNALQVAQQRGQRFVCGHFHENFELRYAGNPNSLIWAVMSGCLIDKKSLAFNYNKLNLNRPLLGCTVIEHGIPTLIPMILSKGGRWIGEIV